MRILQKKMYFWYINLLLNNHIQYLNTILVPLDFDEFQFVFLFLPLVLGDDDEVGIRALEDVLTKCNIQLQILMAIRVIVEIFLVNKNLADFPNTLPL